MIKRVLVASCLAGGLFGTAVAQEPSRSGSEGPFNLRLFAHRVNRPPLPAQTPSSRPEFTLATLVFDAQGRSNELIVRLDHRRRDRLRALLPTLAERSSPDDVERAFLAAMRERLPDAALAFGRPISARYLIEQGRLTSEGSRSPLRAAAREELEQYIVLRYGSVASALAARVLLATETGVDSVSSNHKGSLSWFPDDTYFQPYATFGGPQAMPGVQWGMHVMDFPGAWERTRGFAHVGVVDGGFPGVVTQLDPGPPPSNAAQNLGVILHDDIKANYRSQFNPGTSFGAFVDAKVLGWHATHVAGIIAAQADNGIGVAGGCPSCSVTSFDRSGPTSAILSAMQLAIDSGMQVVNFSGELDGDTQHSVFSCANQPVACVTVQALKDRDVLLVQASGNFNKTAPPFPANLPASTTTVLAVGGTEISRPLLSDGQPTNGSLWVYDQANGSSWAGFDGVLGPARSVVSTAPRYAPAFDYFTAPFAMCGDNVVDESRQRFPGGMNGTGGIGDGYGTCTGTSMAAPHIAALAGLVRSIYPLLSAAAVRTLIQNSGNLAGQRTAQMGAGLPSAPAAVNAAIAANPRRLTPLFAFYSDARSDSFYTTIPQMAAAALAGTLRPRVLCATGPSCTALPTYAASYGVGITSHGASGGAYTNFPGIPTGGSAALTPKAEVWIFTTHENPKLSSMPLVPLYRLSWKCDDAPSGARPAICFTNQSHTDTTYTADTAGVVAFQGIGYKLDGIEGYIYPKAMAQPTGTVRLMRKYNPARDDHAIFPESQLGAMAAQGYTVDTGSDWLGYVYENAGPVPVIQ